jgi:putative cell wall-binding protein
MKKSLLVAVTAAVALVAGGSAASADTTSKTLPPAAAKALKSVQLKDVANPGTNTLRVYGADRYATAVAVSQTMWSQDNAGAVFLATGTTFPDALSAAASTGQLGPVLLTKSDALPEVTRAEIERLHPCVIVVVGGSDVVSDAVAAQADALTDPALCES